jgi:alpha/beta superfamily hydrolase
MLCQSLTRERVTIKGRERFTGELSYDEQAVPIASALLLCPHPFMGGTMENNVIRHLAVVLTGARLVTLRFDYAAISDTDLAANMASFWQTGHAPHDAALVEDARHAGAWLKRQFGLPEVLVGYSFGAHVAASLLDKSSVAIVMIAPTVVHHDLTPLCTARIPKLVIYSNNDFATPQLATDTWYAGLAGPKSKRCLIGGDHFYKRQETDVAEAVISFLGPLLPGMKDTVA